MSAFVSSLSVCNTICKLLSSIVLLVSYVSLDSLKTMGVLLSSLSFSNALCVLLGCTSMVMETLAVMWSLGASMVIHFLLMIGILPGMIL